MKRKLLTTTLVSMSLLTFNLSAGTKCTGKYCIVDLHDLAPSHKKVVTPKRSKSKENYHTVILDNIETIIFTEYKMSKDEVAEYDLEHMSDDISTSDLKKENLPTSEYFCEDNLKPILLKNLPNTYACV